jgi:hypothetical protein
MPFSSSFTGTTSEISGDFPPLRFCGANVFGRAEAALRFASAVNSRGWYVTSFLP